MMISTDAKIVRVHIELTHNRMPRVDMHIHVINNATHEAVALFPTLTHCAEWLKANAFNYVIGTNGVWARA
jgi:hypothetical protein